MSQPVSHKSLLLTRLHPKSSRIAKTNNALPLLYKIMITILIFQFTVYEIYVKLNPGRALGYALSCCFITEIVHLKNNGFTTPSRTDIWHRPSCSALLPELIWEVSGFDLENHFSSLGHHKNKIFLLRNTFKCFHQVRNYTVRFSKIAHHLLTKI